VDRPQAGLIAVIAGPSQDRLGDGVSGVGQLGSGTFLAGTDQQDQFGMTASQLQGDREGGADRAVDETKAGDGARDQE